MSPPSAVSQFWPVAAPRPIRSAEVEREGQVPKHAKKPLLDRLEVVYKQKDAPRATARPIRPARGCRAVGGGIDEPRAEKRREYAHPPPA